MLEFKDSVHAALLVGKIPSVIQTEARNTGSIWSHPDSRHIRSDATAREAHLYLLRHQYSGKQQRYNQA